MAKTGIGREYGGEGLGNSVESLVLQRIFVILTLGGISSLTIERLEILPKVRMTKSPFTILEI